MEVHHHTHTERKKWTHYVWEFLMLFLAVFCGYLAETFREHRIELQRERQYISSLVQDLKADTTNLHQIQNKFDSANKYADTLILLLKSNNRNLESCKIYNLARKVPLKYGAIIPVDQTFQQLKSSGNLRLIHNSRIIDSIGAYYQRYNLLNNGGPGQMLFQNRHDVYLFNYELFDMLAFDKMILSEPDNSFNLLINLDSCEEKPGLLSNDPMTINKICGRYFYLRMSAKASINWIVGMFERAGSLLSNIKKEYHLE